MELDSAMLALGADASGGLLHIFKGGFDAIEVEDVPSALPPMYMVARIIKPDVLTEEDHRFTVTGINPAGEPFDLMKKGELPFKLAPSGYPGEYSKALIIIEIRLIVKSAD